MKSETSLTDSIDALIGVHFVVPQLPDGLVWDEAKTTYVLEYDLQKWEEANEAES
jgi:hypothetical protein